MSTSTEFAQHREHVSVKKEFEEHVDDRPGDVAALPMVRVPGHGYVVDIGRKGPHVIFHLFPLEPNDLFREKMEDAFIGALLFPDKIQAAYEPELQAWSVKAVGLSDNPMANEIATDFVRRLDSALAEAGYPATVPDVVQSPLN